MTAVQGMWDGVTAVMCGGHWQGVKEAGQRCMRQRVMRERIQQLHAPHGERYIVQCNYNNE